MRTSGSGRGSDIIGAIAPTYQSHARRPRVDPQRSSHSHERRGFWYR